MPTTRATVTRSTIKEVQAALPRQVAYTKGLKRALDAKVRRVQEKFLKNFEGHPVTQEIAGGPNATNISGTLGGIGNLLSYIGFQSGDKPLDVVRTLLQKYEIRL